MNTRSSRGSFVWISLTDDSLDVGRLPGSGDFRAAMEDLEEILSRILGRTITLIDKGYPVLEFRGFGTGETNDAVDAFQIVAAGGRVCVTASDERGWSAAIYWMLREWIGARWVWPGPTGECLPRFEEIRIPEGEWKIEPDFVFRGLEPDGPVWEWRSIREAQAELGVDPALEESFALWQRRNLFGGWRVQDGHQMVRLLDPRVYGEAHPEYFALVNGTRQNKFVNGKHGNHPCTSNPEVVEVVAENACRLFRESPELEVLSISPNDGAGFCECPDCLRLDPPAPSGEEGNDGAFHEGTEAMPRRSITDRIFGFANAVAERVYQQFPDRRLLLLVYSAYRDPPQRTKLHPMIIAQFCCQCSRYRNRRVREIDRSIAKGLKRWTNDRGIYEYFDQGAWPGVIRLFPRWIGESVREWYEEGFRYYRPQASWGFGAGAPNLYVLSRMLWNAREDWREVFEEFCRTAFGPAHRELQDYFDGFAQRWDEYQSELEMEAGDTSARGGSFADIGELYPAGFMRQMEGLLRRAREILTESREFLDRLRLIEQGFSFTASYIAASAALVEWCEAGAGKLDPGGRLLCDPEWIDSEQKRAGLQQLLRLWQSVEAQIDTARSEPTLSFFWVRYHRDYRMRGEPLASLRAVWNDLASDTHAQSS